MDQGEFFRQATMRICGTLDIETAIMHCLQYLRKAMPADGMSVHVYERDLNAMRMIALASPDRATKLDHLVPLPIKLREFAEWRQKDNIKLINRSELDPIAQRIIDKSAEFFGESVFSVLAMRLQLTGHRRIGDVALLAKGKDRFTEEHAQLLSLLNEPFAVATSNALRHRELFKLKDMLIDDNRYLHRELMQLSGDEIIGADSGLKWVMEMVRRVAPTNTPVLLSGETGVGKELIANAIQQFSSRKDGPFIKVNCGAIPDTLMDSELFGHEKGAFTGAIAQKRGRFERANEGTIFLDEIGELPPQAQVRLLRVLQNKELERVGGATTIPVDIRVIASTHRNLKAMIDSGLFREDLFFRLNVFPVRIPPLRQRMLDIPALSSYFVEKKSKEMKLRMPPKFAPGAIDRLMAYHWPGNVRELENLVERALIQNREGPLRFESMLSVQERPESSRLSIESTELSPLDDAMSVHIQRALTAASGKVQGP
jgi:transcriptional regulator with GAF, ATPase, and Fis domain